jgi:NAD(P)H-dependent FMN reductase
VGTLVVVENAIRELPHFDPDGEPSPPDAVLRFRTACDGAIGVLLAVPEYAFGIPGSFKKALDWTVGSGSLYRKPVAALNVAPSGRGERVLEALDLVLSALDADVAHYTVPVVRTDIDDSGEISSPSIIEALGDVVAELANRARQTA